MTDQIILVCFKVKMFDERLGKLFFLGSFQWKLIREIQSNFQIKTMQNLRDIFSEVNPWTTKYMV
jgi:hypothetical protein